jgi:hypothetical protein
MEVEKQVCSFELAKRLQELGVKQKSDFYFCQLAPNVIKVFCSLCLVHRDFGSYEKICSALTVAEFGAMLPMHIQGNEDDRTHNHGMFFGDFRSIRHSSGWHIEYVGCFGMNGDNEADARAKMLIHLIEQKLISQL